MGDVLRVGPVFGFDLGLAGHKPSHIIAKQYTEICFCKHLGEIGDAVTKISIHIRSALPSFTVLVWYSKTLCCVEPTIKSMHPETRKSLLR